MPVNVERRAVGSEATPPSGSLEEAQNALLGRLSDDPEDRTAPTERQPEPSKAVPASTEQAPAAPAPESDEDDVESPSDSEAGSEQADDSGEDTPAPQSRTITFTMPDGERVEMTEAEAQRHLLRDRDYTQKTQKLAEERKRFEAEELPAVRQERQQYAETLGQLAQAIQALQPQEPQWDTIPPDQLPQRLADWRSTQKHLTQIQSERERLAGLESEARKRDDDAIFARERTALREAIPDLADPEKGKALEAELTKYAGTYKWTPEELQGVPDHRLFLLLHKAMQFDQQQAKAPTIQNKIERALVTPKPGARGPAKPRDRLQEAKNRVADSGSTEDAASAIAHLI